MFNLLLFGFDNLAVLVVAAVRAHAMRELGLAALGANAARGRIDAVMGAAAGMGADTAHSLFRYCHVPRTPSISSISVATVYAA